MFFTEKTGLAECMAMFWRRIMLIIHGKKKCSYEHLDIDEKILKLCPIYIQ
jgi:hypothetical protein